MTRPSALLLVALSTLALAALVAGPRRTAPASPAIPASVASLEAGEPAVPVATAPVEVRPEAAATAEGPLPGTVLVRGGRYEPLYETAGSTGAVAVASFRLAEVPVTNAEFLAFVTATPGWRRSAVRPLFAEDGYLRHWAADLDLGDAPPQAPVVNVSWFAARAYAAWRGGRLPTTDEWEYAAAASASRADGRDDPDFRRTLLARYSRPTPSPLPDVGQGEPNVWGVRDLHGLVWEWTGDFTSALVTADSRSNRDANARRFCAAGAVGASDFEDYAAFLRFGFRGGLEARYVVPNLGFRLAQDAL